MFVLFLDESGTHGASDLFVLAGAAVEENEAALVRARPDDAAAEVARLGLDPRDYELHGTELLNPRSSSRWAGVPRDVREAVLREAYAAAASRADDEGAARPLALCGAVVSKAYEDYEKRAYALVLKKFETMLTRGYRATGMRHHGMVIHDEHVVEARLQDWTTHWRDVAGTLGPLHHLVEVPLFADSRASRLLQLADLVSCSLWRFYGVHDERLVAPLWRAFDRSPGDREMHGLIHVHPGFSAQSCVCPPCASRA